MRIERKGGEGGRMRERGRGNERERGRGRERKVEKIREGERAR